MFYLFIYMKNIIPGNSEMKLFLLDWRTTLKSLPKYHERRECVHTSRRNIMRNTELRMNCAQNCVNSTICRRAILLCTVNRMFGDGSAVSNMHHLCLMRDVTDAMECACVTVVL